MKKKTDKKKIKVFNIKIKNTHRHTHNIHALHYYATCKGKNVIFSFYASCTVRK